MEIKEDNQRKLILSVLGVAILVVAVIGISFAIYQATFSQNDANSIQTGTITVSYTEPSNAISISDAMPMAEKTALKQDNNKFEFTVTTGASGSLTVPYDISITKIEESDNNLNDENVRVYLTKEDETPVDLSTKEESNALYKSSNSKSRLISELNEYSGRKEEKAKLLYSAQDVFNGDNSETTKSTKYVLRMWVDKNYPMDNGTVSKTYKAKVNVDSVVTPLGTKTE